MQFREQIKRQEDIAICSDGLDVVYQQIDVKKWMQSAEFIF